MPRTIAYRAGGFTNCGISYTKFSQEELAEMKDRVMTESESITKKYCSTCKYYAEYEGVCCNGDSEHCADFRGLDDTCEKWKENEE
ncbi:hypothetical protein [Roseburia intestinalis]|jgi:hypothetical protein|uniref:Uncharacterized protein n=1 Tax=Roseburia intestinalis TaxID=166486 RepID=A0A3R6ARK7_9FIRM|nr:hypothetical protein [Roseburia intestinalis]RHC16755.1 hypothetical protein DW856_10625 [Roseburia intestinalis]DAZ64366.1 MAG TPA: hypothetical protein [Caudoviricetes sp.]